MYCLIVNKFHHEDKFVLLEYNDTNAELRKNTSKPLSLFWLLAYITYDGIIDQKQTITREDTLVHFFLVIHHCQTIAVILSVVYNTILVSNI